MAIQAQMWIKGSKQGDIKGDSIIGKGREKSFDVLSLDHEVTIPHEARTGQIAGKRVHHPMVVETQIGSASPNLFKAVTTNEPLTVQLKFYRPDPDGSEKQYFTIKLEKAFLTSVKTEIPDVGEKAGTKQGHTHFLSFIYSQITWTFEGGAECIDSWAEHF